MVHPKCFFPIAKKTKCRISRIFFVPSKGESVCVGNGPSKMLFPNCKKAKGIISRISFMPPIEREREREYWAGLTVPLSGEASAPTKKCCRVVGAAYCSSPARGSQPPKKKISLRQKRGRLCVGNGPPKMLFPNCKKSKCFINRISFVPSKGECVCVCVGNGPSRMLFPMLLRHGP